MVLLRLSDPEGTVASLNEYGTRTAVERVALVEPARLNQALVELAALLGTVQDQTAGASPIPGDPDSPPAAASSVLGLWTRVLDVLFAEMANPLWFPPPGRDPLLGPVLPEEPDEETPEPPHAEAGLSHGRSEPVAIWMSALLAAGLVPIVPRARRGRAGASVRLPRRERRPAPGGLR